MADALRMCVALGGEAGSIALREWAVRELRGYDGDQELPRYRLLTAPICVDAVQGNAFVGGAIITGQRISPRDLPDIVSEKISESVEIRLPIGEVEHLARQSDAVRLSLPMGADIVRLMNHERAGSMTAINEVYWKVATSSMGSIVDQVRTSLVELVAEIRAGMADDTHLPSAQLADEAVGVVIRGDRNRVVVNAARNSHGSSASLSEPLPTGGSPLRIVAGVLVGVATIAATIFAGIELFAK